MVTTQLLRTIAVWTFGARLRFCRTRLQTANRADQSRMSSKKKIREMVEAGIPTLAARFAKLIVEKPLIRTSPRSADALERKKG
jgi:hypothetical protein